MSDFNQHQDTNSSGGGRRPRRTKRGGRTEDSGPKPKRGGHTEGSGPKAKPKRGGHAGGSAPKKGTGGKYTSKLPRQDLVDKMKAIKRGWKGKCKVRWTIKTETDDEVTYDLAGSSEDVTEFQRQIGLEVIMAYKAPVSKTPVSKAPPSRAPPSRAPPSRAPPSRAPPSRAPPSRAPVSKAPPSRAPVAREAVKEQTPSWADTQPYFGGSRSRVGLDMRGILSAWQPESSVSRRAGNYLEQMYQQGMMQMTHQTPTIIVVNNNYYA